MFDETGADRRSRAREIAQTDVGETSGVLLENGTDRFFWCFLMAP
jgi:hypothetical protein